jgi:hypothetical protein
MTSMFRCLLLAALLLPVTGGGSSPSATQKPARAPNAMASANSLYLGVNLGQAEAFAQKGLGYAFIGTTIDRARAHAGAIKDLPSLAADFDALQQTWATNSAPGNKVKNPAQLERAVTALRSRIAKLAPSLAHQLDAGVRFGNAEAFLALGVEDKWIKSVAIPEAKSHVNAAGVWSQGPSVVDWLLSRQGAADWSQDVEAARRLLFEELVGREPLFRARAAHVQLPIGPNQKVWGPPVYARALVMDDGRQRVAVVSVDTTLFYGENYGPGSNNYQHVLKILKPLTSLDALLVVATHTHHPTTATDRR